MLWIERELVGSDLGTLLHFAPEPSILQILRDHATHYMSADIEGGKGSIVLDFQRIALRSSSVDTVVCSHVLEHVNDEAALAEVFRVLRPGGLSLLMVPIVEGWTSTYEDASVTGDDERTLHFGQADHLRYYGADFRARVRRAGFVLAEFTAEEPDVARFGLVRGEKVFIARKP